MWDLCQTVVVEDWWCELTEQEQDDVTDVVELLAEIGPQLPFPYSSGVEGSTHSQMREEPVYEQKPVAIGAAWTPLLDPSGTGGAMASPRPVRLWGVRPEAACSLALPLAPPGARLGCS